MHTRSKTFSASRTLVGITAALGLWLAAVPPASAQRWVPTQDLNVGEHVSRAILLQNGKVLAISGSLFPSLFSDLYDPATGAWTALGAGGTARTNYATVLLRDGRVLVTGGKFVGPITASCRLFDPETSTWTDAAPMNVARDMHTATLLDDGRVLVVGGRDLAFVTIGQAEIYDPVGDTWTPTGALTTPRARHTATLLADDRVMVTGGQTTGPVTTAETEVFDAAGGSWTTVGPLGTARYAHSATLLPNDRVLVVGGLVTASAELFNPGTGAWTPTASLPELRYQHTATLLPSGLLLVAGGEGSTTRLASAHVYDWTTGQWSPSVPAVGSVPDMITARHSHAATMLPDGRVLIAGGTGAAAVEMSAELFDADVPTWTGLPTIPNMNADRNESTATLLRNGQVLVAGGYQEDTAELFDPGDPGPPVIPASWTLTGNDMSRQRWRHSATLLLDERVLVAGSRANTASSRTADVYDPVADAWSATGDLVGGRSTHTATLLPDGEVLIAGGQTPSGTILGTAERFDPGTGTWQSTTSMGTVRWRQAATLLRDGRVLVTGGFELAALDTAEIYDPSQESWTPIVAAMTVPRYFHTSTLLPSGKVLLVGGASSPISAELFDPVTGNFTSTGNLNFAHDSNFTATLLTNGRVLVLGGIANPQAAEVYDPVTGTWTVAPNTIGERAAHAASILPDGRVLVAGSLPIGPTAEVYDVGRGEDRAWRPVLATVTNPLVDGAPLVATGSQFQGISEASTGLGHMQSATNYPLIQLRRLDNEDTRWLLVDKGAGWSDTDFTSLPLGGLAPGPVLVTVFTNGIPSDSRMVTTGCTAPVITAQPTDLNLCLGAPAVFSVGTSASFPSFEWRKDGAPLVDGGPVSGVSTATLLISPTVLADAGNYDVVVSTCSTTTTLSAPAVLTVSNAPNLSNVDVALTSPPATVCATCVGGTISESHLDGGFVTHEWGYRTVPTVGAITWMPGQTGPTYDIDGADFPGPGTYYVVVRTTPACGLPLVSVSEVTVTVTPLAPSGDEVQFFTVTSRDRENVLEWVNSGGWGDVRILYNEGAGCIFPTDPLGPSTGSFDWPGVAGLRNSLVHGVPLTPPLTNDMDYCYTIFSDMGGPPYSVGVSNRGRPMDPSLGVIWSFSTGTFSLTAPTVGWSGIIATSNDHVVHAMQRGLAGGEWPGPWLPIRLNGPVQSRSPIVPITVNTSNPVVYLGSQDGNVYVVDADRGGALPGYPRAPAPLGGSPGQAAPAGIFSAFGGGYDYLLVGTRDTVADNRFFAFTPDLVQAGVPFNNGGGLNSIGIINGMATVEYPNRRVFFTSHTRGSPDTLWCLQLQTGPPATTYRWSRPFGDIDSSPVLMGDRVYVVASLPTPALYSIEADMGMAPDRTFPIPDGQAKGFVFPDWRTGDLYFATDNYVWALHDDGASISNKFPLLAPPGGIDLGGGVIPTSSVVFVPGSHYVYVGGDDGKLYEIDVLAGPAPTIKSVVLGDGLATVGAPSLDWQNSLIHVGTEAGVFYAVPVPLP